jgi:hypothetical protein
MDMYDRNCQMNKSKLHSNKIRGQFNVCMREDIKMKLKVATFAQEPLSFLIHKNRKLFPKLMKKKQEDEVLMHKYTRDGSLVK